MSINPNDYPNLWFNDIGVNTFPRNGKIPIIPYKQFRNKRIPVELFNQWKNEGRFEVNMCCMIGKLSGQTSTLNYARRGLYLNFADFDNDLAIKELCFYKGKQFILEEMARIAYIVQHADDRSHCHVYWISSKPMAKRTLDKDRKILAKIKANELPSVEIKGAGSVAFCSGGFHESGNQYLPLGTTEICIIEELGDHIHSICRKYKLPVSDSERNKLRRKEPIQKVGSKSTNNLLTDYDYQEEEWTEILESSRNNTLFDRARRYYRKNKDLLSADTFRTVVTFMG